MVSKYGHIYDRRYIEEWIRRKGICPFTCKVLQREDLFNVYALKIDIQEFKRQAFATTATTE